MPGKRRKKGDRHITIAGGPDSLSIGAAKPQEVFHAVRTSSCACGTPIAELSGPPAKLTLEVSFHS